MTTPYPPQGEPQYQPIPQSQQPQPPPYVYGQPPPVPPKKNKTWLWILLGIAAVVLICCGAFAISAMTGDDNSEDTSGQGGGGTDQQPAPTATMPGIGDPVRDGKFEFTVRSVECGVDQVGPAGFGETAQGQFCLVTMTVKNIGDEPQTLFESDQKGVGSNGAEYSSNSAASLYANDSNSQVWITEINPGNEVTGVIVYDVPQDVTLSQLELHDSGFSDGVKVSLQ